MLRNCPEIRLSTAYFPPVSYISLFTLRKPVLIEREENYLKQTYRNRCTILSANGPLSLSIPVQRGSFHKTPIRDLKIETDQKWRQDHCRALRAAYNASPFYEFFEDEIRELIYSQETYLLDFNQRILEYVLENCRLETRVEYSKSFLSPVPSSPCDLRYKLQPKQKTPLFFFQPAEYIQVFSDRRPFVPDLSILDVLFNLGPEAGMYLNDCLKKN